MPERHGQFFTHMQLEPGSYRIGKRYADDITLPPFWDALEAAGLETALVDVPQTRPKPGFHGAHVVGWGGEYPAWPSSSAPPELMAEIHRAVRLAPACWTIGAWPGADGRGTVCSLCRDLRRGRAAKADLTRWLFARQPFDLSLTVFSETHWAMHRFGTCSTRPTRDMTRNSPTVCGVMRDILGIIDGLIGDLREARPGGNMLVFSLSGMGPNYSGSHCCPRSLNAWASALATARGARAACAGLGRQGRRGRPQFRADVDGRSQAAGASALWDRATRRLLYAGAGWAETQAFCLPNDYSGAIRINLIGREPAGRVAPGAEMTGAAPDRERHARTGADSTGEPAVGDILRLIRANGTPWACPT